MCRAASARDLAHALEVAGLEATITPDGAVLTLTTTARIGQVAHAAGIRLIELRATDRAGLEEMFLELTAETQREGAAA